jgi:hypothetical protein
LRAGLVPASTRSNSELTEQGPPLERLTHRLAECPPDFLEPPMLGQASGVHTAAVVYDLLCDLGAREIPIAWLRPFRARSDEPAEAARLSVVLVACWLLHDDWFRAAGRFAPAAHHFLAEALTATARLVRPDHFVTEPEQREELARLCLAALGLRPAGETEDQAEDRLATVNSVERARVVRASRTAHERAQAVRGAMAQRAALESVPKYNRE